MRIKKNTIAISVLSFKFAPLAKKSSFRFFWIVLVILLLSSFWHLRCSSQGYLSLKHENLKASAKPAYQTSREIQRKRLTYSERYNSTISSYEDPPLVWARVYGGVRNDDIQDIQPTSDGGFIIAANSMSFLDLGHTIGLVIKCSAMGEIEWQYVYYSSRFTFIYSIRETHDGDYIVAGLGTQSPDLHFRDYADFLVFKLNADGSVKWVYTYPQARFDSAFSIHETNDNGFIVAGIILKDQDVMVLKLDAMGVPQWKKRFGGPDYEGSYYIEQEPPSVSQTSDGGYLVGISSQSFGEAWGDVWLAKLFSDGEIEWQRAYGSPEGEAMRHPSAILQTHDGGYFFSVETNLHEDIIKDILLVKLFPDGQIEWQKTYDSGGDDVPFSALETASGEYIIAGSIASLWNPERDVYQQYGFLLMKVSSQGILRWAKSYDLSRREVAKCVRQTGDGGLLIAGSTGARPPSGGSEILVIKTDSMGNLSSGCEIVNEVNLYDDNIWIWSERTFISGKNLKVSAATPDEFTAIKTTFEHSQTWCGNYKKAKRPR